MALKQQGMPVTTPKPNGISIHNPDRFAAATSGQTLANLSVQPGQGLAIMPTNLALYGPGAHREATNFEDTMRLMTDMSPNYRGDPSNSYNHSQTFLPDHLNCSFWITGLPKDITPKEIFDQIRGCGKIYALHINNKEAMAGRKRTAAAKLIFFDADGASKFYDKTILPRELQGTGGGFLVRGHRAFVVRNRIKAGPQMGLHPSCSRVLTITGPPHLVNYEWLVQRFNATFKFELEDVIDHSLNESRTILEVRFAAWRAQAAVASKMIKRDRRFRRVWVKFSLDPCA